MPRENRVQIFQSRPKLFRRKQYYARVVAPNGEELVRTSEGYNNLDDLIAVTDDLFPHLQRGGVGEGWDN